MCYNKQSRQSFMCFSLIWFSCSLSMSAVFSLCLLAVVTTESDTMPGQIPDPCVTAGSLPSLGPLAGISATTLTDKLKFGDFQEFGTMLSPLHFLDSLGKRPLVIKTEVKKKQKHWVLHWSCHCKQYIFEFLHALFLHIMKKYRSNNPNTVFQIYHTDSSLTICKMCLINRKQICLNWKRLCNYSFVSYLNQQVHLVDIVGHVNCCWTEYTAGSFHNKCPGKNMISVTRITHRNRSSALFTRAGSSVVVIL